MRSDPVARVIEKLNGVTPVAEMLGLSPQAVSQWTVIPIKHVRALAKATKIPRELLRPDVFAQEDENEAA